MDKKTFISGLSERGVSGPGVWLWRAQGPGTDTRHSKTKQQTIHTSTQRTKPKPVVSNSKSYILRAMWDRRMATEAHSGGTLQKYQHWGG